MGLDPGTATVIASLIGTGAGFGQQALQTTPDGPAQMTDPAAQKQMRAAQGGMAGQPMSQQVFGQQPAPPTTPGIDIGQIIALLAQSGGLR